MVLDRRGRTFWDDGPPPRVRTMVPALPPLCFDTWGSICLARRDLPAFGRAVEALLRDPGRAARIGRAAHRRILEQFLPDRHLQQWMDLLQRLPGSRETEN
jgi:glycosyltransferase involved in cell wall biosynthesis